MRWLYIWTVELGAQTRMRWMVIGSDERGMQAGAVDEIHESDGEKTKYLPHLERPGLHCVR